MAGAEYAYQIDDNYEVGIPRKRFSFLSLLSKIRNLCILVLVVFIAYTAWPSIHYDSYLRFQLMLGLIFNKKAFQIIVDNVREGFNFHPIGRSLELIVLTVAIWKADIQREDHCIPKSEVNCDACSCVILALSDPLRGRQD